MRVLQLISPLFLLIASLNAMDTPSNNSKSFNINNSHSLNDNKKAVLELYTIMQDNDIQRFGSLITPDYKVTCSGDIQDSPYSRFTEMSKNLKIRIMALHKALPEFKLEVSELFAEEDKVFAKVTISGVHKGNFLGISPTNKPILLKFFHVFTLKEGKIVHLAEMWNELSVMKQLGDIIL